MKIFSKNATYQKFEVLLTNRNKRYRYGEFLVEGVRNINEAIQNDWKIVSFLYPSGRKLSDWAASLLRDVSTQVNYELSEGLMSELSGKGDTSELLAVVQMKSDEEPKLSETPILALFDRPSNKGNLGTLLRSCDAFGVERLILTGHAVDVYDPEVVGASMGSFFKVPFVRMSDNAEIDEYIARLRQRYPLLKVVGTTARQGKSLFDVELTTPILFLIGSETDGLNWHLCELCDVIATIPMSEGSSASSLNVGCAATVLFYETARQRGECGRLRCSV